MTDQTTGVCSQCSALVQPGQRCCPSCGTAVMAPAAAASPVGFSDRAPRTNTTTNLVLAGVVALAVVGIVTHLHSAPDKPLSAVVIPTALPDEPSPEEVPPPSPSPEVVLSPADQAKQNDKGWVLESNTPHVNDLGHVDIVARIKNGNSETSTASFTITFLDGETVVSTYVGFANGILPQQTSTVDMTSTSPLTRESAQALGRRPHPHIEFQTDTSMAG